MKIKLTIGKLVWVDIFLAWPVMVYRLLKYGYTYRRIYLGEGQWTILDQPDYYRLRNYKWFVYGTGHNLYAVRYKLVSPKKTSYVSMHREIMKPTDDRFVDHRNCDSLDNRKSNLRFATPSENIRNRRKMKNATSQYYGVGFCKEENNWHCRITREGKRIRIGRFKSEIAAAHAYDEAAKKYYGEFARLNFPQVDPRRFCLPLCFLRSKLRGFAKRDAAPAVLLLKTRRRGLRFASRICATLRATFARIGRLMGMVSPAVLLRPPPRFASQSETGGCTKRAAGADAPAVLLSKTKRGGAPHLAFRGKQGGQTQDLRQKLEVRN